MTKRLKFRDLPIGEEFDFVGPVRMFNSFYKRCTKRSARTYVDEDGVVHRVGSINANVFNVGSSEPQMFRMVCSNGLLFGK